MQMKRTWTLTWGILCLTLMVILTPGCNRGRHRELGLVPIDGEPPVSREFPVDKEVRVSKLPTDPLDPLSVEKIPGMTIYFDFDSSALRADALETLNGLAKLVKETPDMTVQIEGHCDERGTQEYNFALGDRRAQATRNHLIKLGVSGEKLYIVSFGEEVPAVESHDEAAWAKNRRCEFKGSQ